MYHVVGVDYTSGNLDVCSSEIQSMVQRNEHWKPEFTFSPVLSTF